MDPELDAEIDALLAEDAPAAEPRMQRSRRLILGEGGSEEGSRVEEGDFVDANAPIAPVPASADEKAPRSGPTSAQRARWEVLTGQTEGGETPSALWDAMLGSAPHLGGASLAGDEGSAGAARSRERLSRLWDQVTSSDARLGGRNRVEGYEVTSGRDRRGDAGAAGAVDGVTLGFADELAGGAAALAGGDYETERNRVRRMDAETAAQAPELYGVGEAAGTAPWLLAPNPATALGRVGMGAAMGGASAAGHSTADPLSFEFATDVGAGTALGAGTGALAEGASALLRPQRAADAISRRADLTQRTADQARLEASGVWGGSAMRAAEELPGGTERLAGDLRRLGIGERGPGRAGFDPAPPPRGLTIPRMDRAALDSEQLRRAAGSQMAGLARQADEAGAQVSTLGVRSRVEDLAQELDRLPIGGRESAGQLREMTADLANGGDLSFSDAWAQRQMLDDMIGSYQRDPNLSRLSGRLQTVRDALHAEMTRAAQDVGLGRAWQGASRDYQVGAFMRDSGRGGQRLSVGGGMGGANAAGDIVAEAVTSGSPTQVALAVPRQMAGRAISQETRMAFPGVRARVGEASAGIQRTTADALYRLAQTEPARLGPLAAPVLEAGGRGSAALLSTLYVLSQRDARARQILNDLQAEDGQE